MRFPTLDEVIACNELVREPDEFSPSADDDDLALVEGALHSAREVGDAIDAAAVLVYELVAAQGFFDGNKRTAVLIGRWFLSVNTDRDPDVLIRPDDRELGELLVRAARGDDVEEELVTLLRNRA